MGETVALAETETRSYTARVPRGNDASESLILVIEVATVKSVYRLSTLTWYQCKPMMTEGTASCPCLLTSRFSGHLTIRFASRFATDGLRL